MEQLEVTMIIHYSCILQNYFRNTQYQFFVAWWKLKCLIDAWVISVASFQDVLYSSVCFFRFFRYRLHNLFDCRRNIAWIFLNNTDFLRVKSWNCSGAAKPIETKSIEKKIQYSAVFQPRDDDKADENTCIRYVFLDMSKIRKDFKVKRTFFGSKSKRLLPDYSSWELLTYSVAPKNEPLDKNTHLTYSKKKKRIGNLNVNIVTYFMHSDLPRTNAIWISICTLTLKCFSNDTEVNGPWSARFSAKQIEFHC